MALVNAAATTDILLQDIANIIKTYPATHLLAWKEDSAGVAGLSQGPHITALDTADTAAIVIYFMRPAKGCGYVALEARTKQHNRSIKLLESQNYNEEAFNWLMEKRPLLESFFACEIVVHDDGYDC